VAAEGANKQLRILFLTDAWPPQLNGVAIGSRTHVEHLRAAGHEVRVVSPICFKDSRAPPIPTSSWRWSRRGG
jgi:hypothetical protein